EREQGQEKQEWQVVHHAVAGKHIAVEHIQKRISLLGPGPCLFLFQCVCFHSLFLSAIRSLALLALGLRSISSFVGFIAFCCTGVNGLMGFPYRSFSSFPSKFPVLMNCFTNRSS